MNGKHVLVVDDASVARVVLRQILIKSGFEVFEADNGRDAIRTYNTVRPDVVTMDLQMDSMNGLTTIQGILTIDPRARIVVCSSTQDPHLVVQAIRMGARAFVAKPFTPETLNAALAKALA